MYKEAKAKGYIAIDELGIFNDMYEQYHRLGGNGTITALKEKLNNSIDIKDEPL